MPNSEVSSDALKPRRARQQIQLTFDYIAEQLGVIDEAQIDAIEVDHIGRKIHVLISGPFIEAEEPAPIDTDSES